MYSTIQEAWGNNLLSKYANNFDNIIKPKETFSNNHINDDYLENLSEYFDPKLVKKMKKELLILVIDKEAAELHLSHQK